MTLQKKSHSWGCTCNECKKKSDAWIQTDDIKYRAASCFILRRFGLEINYRLKLFCNDLEPPVQTHWKDRQLLVSLGEQCNCHIQCINAHYVSFQRSFFFQNRRFISPFRIPAGSVKTWQSHCKLLSYCKYSGKTWVSWAWQVVTELLNLCTFCRRWLVHGRAAFDAWKAHFFLNRCRIDSSHAHKPCTWIIPRFCCTRGNWCSLQAISRCNLRQGTICEGCWVLLKLMVNRTSSCLDAFWCISTSSGRGTGFSIPLKTFERRKQASTSGVRKHNS